MTFATDLQNLCTASGVSGRIKKIIGSIGQNMTDKTTKAVFLVHAPVVVEILQNYSRILLEGDVKFPFAKIDTAVLRVLPAGMTWDTFKAYFLISLPLYTPDDDCYTEHFMFSSWFHRTQFKTNPNYKNIMRTLPARNAKCKKSLQNCTRTNKARAVKAQRNLKY